MLNCPCCSGKPYIDCCGMYLSGEAKPTTPEALMRSRYTAYTQANMDYIQQTMRGPAATHFDKQEAESWAKQVRWIKLEVLQTQYDDKQGLVEFIAHYLHEGKKLTLHELSQFQNEKGCWYYTDSKPHITSPPVRHLSSNKVGRNDPCPCGSQKKFKKCCEKL